LDFYFDFKANFEPELLTLAQSVLMGLACQLPHVSVIVAADVKKYLFMPVAGHGQQTKRAACTTLLMSGLF
jgi:hypothetical protein